MHNITEVMHLNFSDGMKIFLTIEKCYGRGDIQEPLSGKVRQYFMSAETETWDYAPYGTNRYDGSSLTEPGR